MANEQGTKLHQGGCHCGAVRFEVEIDVSQGARCNCSICTKVAGTSTYVKPEAFRLLTSEEELSTYEWGRKTGTGFFCKHCGVHCFARGSLPQLGGAYVALKLNCIDEIDLTEVKVVYWDGRHDNWEAGPRDTPWPVRAPAAPPA